MSYPKKETTPRARLLVSVSGGRTSGYMAHWVNTHLNEVQDRMGAEAVTVLYAFANTGMEHDDTLRFVRDLDRRFELNVVWLEGETQHGKRKSTQFRVVDYDSAFRNDQWLDPRHPFHATIMKYGIPNAAFPHCTREMKRRTIESYARSVWPGEPYHTAIGIRSDESRRVAAAAAADRIVYPLVDWSPVDKEDITDWWSEFEWDLQIPEYLGNCVTCWKKSFRKLSAVYRDGPRWFDFTRHMEAAYPRVGAEFRKDPTARDRTFFRLHNSTETLTKQFRMIAAGETSEDLYQVQDGGCSESCELYPTEAIAPRLHP